VAIDIAPNFHKRLEKKAGGLLADVTCVSEPGSEKVINSITSMFRQLLVSGAWRLLI